MNFALKPRVKICCIASLAEARLAIHYGASAVGLVSEMPSGPGIIDEELIAAIAGEIPPPISCFLLTSRRDAPSIIAQQKRCGVDTLQLCDAVDPDCYEELRAQLPGISIVQVIHVQGQTSLHEAVSVSVFVDALLLDSGNQKLAVKELGGTGRTHDWSISRAIREAVDVPVFLAGGLNHENIQDAVRTVEPFGVDICSGVRVGGRLDETRLRKFFETIESQQFA